MSAPLSGTWPCADHYPFGIGFAETIVDAARGPADREPDIPEAVITSGEPDAEA